MKKLLAIFCLLPALAFANNAVMTNDAHQVIAKDAAMNFTGITVSGLAWGGITGIAFDQADIRASLAGAYRVLGDVSASATDTMIHGLTASSATQNLFISRDNSGSGTYVRSVTHFAHGVDLTSVSVYGFNAVAISPRHVVFPHHVGVSNGTSIRFVTAGNVTVSRTLSSSSQIGSTDVQIGLLSSDLPDTIRPARVLTTTTQETTVTTGSPVLFTDQNYKIYVSERNQSAEGSNSLNIAQASTSPRSTFWKSGGLVGGDSGGAIGVVVDGVFVVLSTAHTANSTMSIGSDSIARHYAAVNTAMTNLGGGYQLSPFVSETLPTFLSGNQSATEEGGTIVSAGYAYNLADSDTSSAALSYSSGDRQWYFLTNADVDLRNSLGLLDSPVFTGAVKGTTFMPVGTATTCTGATIGTGSKSNAGFVTATTTGTSTIVITFPVTAPTGWNAYASDGTALTNLVQTASSTTTATISGATTSGDIIRYIAMPY